MKIVFAGIQLTDWGTYPAQGFSINGQEAYEAAEIIQSARQKLFDRGNQLVTLQFSVTRQFTTNVDCQVYLLTHFSTLPKSGLCVVTCGAGAEATQDVNFANAVLSASPQGSFTGLAATVQYTIVAPGADTTYPPDFLLGGDAMILRGRIALTAADTGKAIVFSTPFATGTKPVLTSNISKPATGDNIWTTNRDDLTSETGTTIEFSAPIPAAGYYLNWTAAPAS